MMNIFYNGKYYEEYYYVQKFVFNGMIKNITQIIFVVSIGSIDAGDKNSHKYYLIYFSSLPYNIQGNKSVDGKLI